ncbi:hypothetical protein C1N58_16265 [Pantoea sp. SGAir0180]
MNQLIHYYQVDVSLAASVISCFNAGGMVFRSSNRLSQRGSAKQENTVVSICLNSSFIIYFKAL